MQWFVLSSFLFPAKTVTDWNEVGVASVEHVSWCESGSRWLVNNIKVSRCAEMIQGINVAVGPSDEPLHRLPLTECILSIFFVIINRRKPVTDWILTDLFLLRLTLRYAVPELACSSFRQLDTALSIGVWLSKSDHHRVPSWLYSRSRRSTLVVVHSTRRQQWDWRM